MSTTQTLEAEVADIRRAEIAAYTMPKPAIGQPVMWFPSGTRQTRGEVVFVIRAGNRNIVVQRAGGICEEGVRHIDDPKLQLSEEQRIGGAWDFTDDAKNIVAYATKLADLEARVKYLEELFDKPSKK